MQYLIVIEKAQDNFSSYVPDIPGCVATGKTIKEVKQRIAEALMMHIAGLEEDGELIPSSTAVADYVAISKSA